MKDDKTIIMQLGEELDSSDMHELVKKEKICVIVNAPSLKDSTIRTFDESFSIGRSKANNVIISDSAISRKHLEIKKEKGAWFVYDLKSANGSFLQDIPISQQGEPLVFPSTITFGYSQYSLTIKLVTEQTNTPVDDATQILRRNTTLSSIHSDSDSGSIEALTSELLITKKETVSPEEIQKKYFSKRGHENAGEYTQLIRVAIQEHKQKKNRNYKIGIGIIALLLVFTVGLIIYQQSIISHTKVLALDMFYDMKEIEVSLGKVEYQLQNEIEKIKQQETKDLLLEAAYLKRENLQKMKKKYRAYLQKVEAAPMSKIKTLFKPTKYEEQLILQVARKFGESELEVPKNFSNEVTKYIRYWQKTPRLKRAMQHLKNKKYKKIILNALKKHHLPPQFLYLVLQESNFRRQAIGPETRFGIAKGAWQFLPETGAEFGLKPGPLAKTLEYDPLDERFNIKKASLAGAKYLKQIYSTEAQASGLLVLAGYNYGHNRVKALIRKMPKNPRERNFWKFIQKNKIPQETYDYVFYIFAAAVIGENPKYFGFSFRSPTSTQ